MNNYYPYVPAVQPQQQAVSSIIWVQGEAGAKSYLVGAGQSVLLMDSEASRFYIKSTDASGMPMPLRMFEYTEEHQPSNQTAQYVTRDEFKKWAEEITSKINNLQEGV